MSKMCTLTLSQFFDEQAELYFDKKPNAKNIDNKQFNALLYIVKEKKCGVRATFLVDFANCLQLFSDLLRKVDPHYDKSKRTHLGRQIS